MEKGLTGTMNFGGSVGFMGVGVEHARSSDGASQSYGIVFTSELVWGVGTIGIDVIDNLGGLNTGVTGVDP